MVRSFVSFGVLAFSILSAGPAFAVLGAELIRREPLRYGKFEARIQFAPGDGVISSFFLWKDGSEMPDVFWNEIDIEKLGEDCAGYSSNALYGLPQANHNQEIPVETDLCASFHTHAIEWTPDYLAWFLDGTEVRRITGADLQAFEDNALPGMQMRFNLWVGNENFGGTFTPDVLPVHQFINWVAYSQYAPGAGDGGSDFALAWREDFDRPLSGDWFLGTWPSPYNLSVHAPSNLTIVDGKAVLSLTADDAPGFSGEVPQDSDESASSGASSMGAGAAAGLVDGMSGEEPEAPNGRPSASGGCQLSIPSAPRLEAASNASTYAIATWLAFGLWRRRRSASSLGDGRAFIRRA